jgi:methionyl-tRNA formyltransferase
MKVVYFGTPEYAVPALKALIDSHHEVMAVVTQPDRPRGRSNKLQPTPVKQMALDNNIRVFQYEKIRKEDIAELLAIDADIYVTCAYGQILDEKILKAKKHGVINLHGSILPKYRGASPVQWTLINGDKETGVTILRSEIGIDDGDILLTKTIQISEDENAITLFEKLSNLSAEAVLEGLELIESGKAEYTPQDHEKASICKMLNSDMGTLDFGKSVDEIVGLIKGLAMWPNAHITIDGIYFKLYNAKRYSGEVSGNFENGEVVIASSKQGLVIKCNDGYVEITELLPINSKKMTAKSYLNGKVINVGSKAE